MRAFAPVPVAIVVCVAAPAFASAQSHVKAARKAEKRGEWRKALQEWKAAYAAELNAEYLIGIGDAYVHLGNKGEARKSYEAYLSDPLAIPARVSRVRAKLAALDAAPERALALPGPGLTLPGAKPEPMLPLPGIDASATSSARNESVTPPPPLPLPGIAPAAKKEPDAIALAGSVPPLPLPGMVGKPEAKKEAAPAVATKESAKPAKPIAVVTAAPEKAPAPVAALAVTPLPREPQAGSSSRVQRTMAYVTAGVAIAALGGGTYAFMQANSAHNDLTNKVHSSADAQRLLESERQNKTLSFVGFAGGLVAAGIATALFAF